MAVVQILTDGNPTPSLNHTLGQAVTFTNVDNTPGLVYLWELVEDPAWTQQLAQTVTVTTNPAAASFTITPQKRGTYLIRLTLNPNTPGQVTGTTVLAIQHTNIRIPSVRETTESGVDGWGPPVQDALNQLDTLLTDAVTQYGNAAELSNVTSAAETAGVLNKAARADHKHDINVASPSDIGSLAEQGGLGVSTSLARADHRHGTIPQNPGTEMGADFAGWKVYATDALVRSRLMTQGIALIAQNTDMTVLDPLCHIILCDTNNASLTITLPPAGGTLQGGPELGRVLRIKNIGSGRVVIQGAAPGELIDGAANTILRLPNASVDLVTDGASWWRLGSFPTPARYLRWNGLELGNVGGGTKYFDGVVYDPSITATETYQIVPACTASKLIVRVELNQTTAGTITVQAKALLPDASTVLLGNTITYVAGETGVRTTGLAATLPEGSLVWVEAVSSAAVDQVDVDAYATVELLAIHY